MKEPFLVKGLLTSVATLNEEAVRFFSESFNCAAETLPLATLHIKALRRHAPKLGHASLPSLTLHGEFFFFYKLAIRTRLSGCIQGAISGPMGRIQSGPCVSGIRAVPCPTAARNGRLKGSGFDSHNADYADAMACSLVKARRRFGGKYCLNLLRQRLSEAVDYPEIFESLYHFHGGTR